MPRLLGLRRLVYGRVLVRVLARSCVLVCGRVLYGRVLVRALLYGRVLARSCVLVYVGGRYRGLRRLRRRRRPRLRRRRRRRGHDDYDGGGGDEGGGRRRDACSPTCCLAVKHSLPAQHCHRPSPIDVTQFSDRHLLCTTHKTLTCLGGNDGLETG